MRVLFIVMDQLRADLLDGALGSHAPLPNLRALMAAGVSFTEHVTVANPCGPARASLLTAQYAMNHRSLRNGAPLRADTPTLPAALRQAGVLPLLFGYTDTTLDPRGLAPEDPALKSYEQPMPGFDEVVEMRMEESWPWRAHLAARGYDLPASADFYVPVAQEGRARRPDDPAFYRAEDSDTAYLTDRFLDEMRVRAGQPVLAHLTYIRPHPPLVAPAPYNRLIDPLTLSPPVPTPEDPSLARHPLPGCAKSGNWAGSMVDGFPELKQTEANAQTLRALYLGLAAEVDVHLGRVFDFLKATGAWNETLVVVTADHGEMLGDAGQWGKTAFFDAAWRVPLIIRDPGRPAQHGTRVAWPTESTDVMPTILDWLGAGVPASVNGRSLLPFLDGRKPEEWREATMSEMWFGDPVTPSRWQASDGLDHRDAMFAILRSGRYRLVDFACGYPPVLFDMQAEGEARNLAGDPAHAGVLLEMTQALLRHRMRNGDSTLSDIQITPDGAVGPRWA